MAMNTDFHRIKRLPPYIFEEVNRIKARLRAQGVDIIDFGMGNPDMPTPQHIVDKLVETTKDPKSHRYSASKGIPDLRRAMSEFHRVLRPDGWAAASITTSPERSYNGTISLAVARHVPSMAAVTARRFSLGDERRLRSLFEGSGFQDVDITTEAHRFILPSFDAYFAPFERGGGSSGQALVALPEEVRRAVREEIRWELRDTGGPIEIEVEIRIASGRR